MKKRVKKDNLFLATMIFFSVIFFMFPRLYVSDMLFDDILDFIGMISVLMGIFLRMVARGHKKANSAYGEFLVITGPYQMVRNPMYLGSFFLGAGFIFMVWPFWVLPLFALGFYFRFIKQIKKEEEFLKEEFGREYLVYCEKVPRFIPNWRTLRETRFREAFPMEMAWVTKEKRGLLGWPIGAVILELIQEKVVFGFTDLWKILFIFGMTIIVFMATVLFFYYRR